VAAVVVVVVVVVAVSSIVKHLQKCENTAIQACKKNSSQAFETGKKQ
jgi:hypothetical protein